MSLLLYYTILCMVTSLALLRIKYSYKGRLYEQVHQFIHHARWIISPHSVSLLVTFQSPENFSTAAPPPQHPSNSTRWGHISCLTVTDIQSAIVHIHTYMLHFPVNFPVKFRSQQRWSGVASLRYYSDIADRYYLLVDIIK